MTALLINRIFYIIMLVGFFGLSVQNPSKEMKIIGILLTIVNALLFKSMILK